MHADGGFSNYVLVEHPRYLVEYEPLSASFAATLGCSGLTAFSALKKAAPADAEHPLLIIGAGGLGLAAVSLCHALYGIGPIVADVDAAKRQAALEAGASVVIDPADPDARKSLLADTGGMFSAIDFVGAEKSAAFGLSLLRKGGRLFVVGLFGGSLAISLPTLPIRGISIIGVFTGTLPEFQELMALAREGKVKPAPIETRALDDGAAIAGRSACRTRSRSHRADRVSGRRRPLTGQAVLLSLPYRKRTSSGGRSKRSWRPST